jgi:predicted transposase YdaD
VPKSFDATTKFLVETHPADWVRLLGLPYAEAKLLDTDLSTVTAAADTLLRVNTVPPYLLILDFQGNQDTELLARLQLYRALVRRENPRLAIACALILLRPFAGHRELTGTYEEHGPDGDVDSYLRYRVIRVWELPPEVFLEGGLATLPLAVVSQVRKNQLPDVLKQVEYRLNNEARPSEADRLRTASFVLMGLKYDPKFVEKLMGKNVLELSSTYQALMKEGLEKGIELGREQGREQGLEQGKEQALRASLLRIGEKRLGKPTETVLTTLGNVRDSALLEQLLDAILEAESWDELLAA